jgi:hypothetical protein
MPLGISESAIKAAYGPIDLSGLYKGIEAFAKKSEYNDKLERQALQKEYYSSLAVLNKSRDKMNPNDSSDFMNHYNKYKSAQQKLIANPRLIDSNPDEYGKLASQSEEAYTKASTLAGASKVMQDKITKMHDYAYKNPTKFEDGALEKIASLSNMKTQDIINQGLDDIDKYVYQGPDLEKFNKGIGGIEDNKENKVKTRINQWEDANIGASVYNLYNILDPVKVSNDVNRTLALQQNPSKAASVLLEKFGDQVDKVKSDWDNLKDEDFAKFKTPEGKDLFPMHNPFGDLSIPQTRKPDVIRFDGTTPQAKLAAFLTARPIITSVLSPQEEGTGNYTEFDKGKIGEKDLVKKYAIELQTTLANIRQNLALAKISQQFANKKALKEIDKTADAKFKVMLNVIGSAYKTDISRGIKNLDSPTIGELETVLNQVANDMKPAKKKLY